MFIKILLIVVPVCLGTSLKTIATRWDAEHFINIAEHGYRNLGDIAFAPLFPLLIRTLTQTGLNPWISALLTANLASLTLIPILCKLYTEHEALAILVFPTLLVFTTLPYSEAITLPLLAYALYHALNNRWEHASLYLYIAGLARYQTGFITAALTILLLLRKEWKNAAYLTLSGAILVISVIILSWKTMSDPLAYLHAEKLWDASIGIPLVSQAKWLWSSWFTREPWTMPLLWDVVRIRPWMWLVRNLVFYAIYSYGLLLLIKNKKYIESTWTTSILLLTIALTGVPAISAPRLLIPAFPAIAAVATRKKPGPIYILLSTAIALWIMVWQLKSFFS